MKCKNCKREIPENSLFCNWCGKYQIRQREEITVPKPRQLSSGNWNIELRKENLSITESTPEKCTAVAKRARRQWLADEAAGLHQAKADIVTLESAITSFIDALEGKRSMTTIRAYRSYLKNRYIGFLQTDINELDTQELVDAEIDRGAAAKYVHNLWGLVRSSLRYAKVLFDPPVLPKMVPSERNWLDYKQIEIFLKAVRGKPCELGALLGLHSLRASETFGLRLPDYDRENKIIHVRGAYHRLPDGWVRTEANKTAKSRRDVPIIIPRLTELLDAFPKDTEYFIGATDPHLCDHINAVCRSAGLPETGNHGLRHSFASLAYHLGWKKLSTMKIGGWSNSRILDEIYTHNADLDADLETMREFYRS